MIDTFVHLRQKLQAAFQTIFELRSDLERQELQFFESNKKLALKIIEQIDQCEDKQDQGQVEFLESLLLQIGVSRIPPPIDQSPDYSKVIRRASNTGKPSGTVLGVEGGAFVFKEELIRPAGLVIAE